MAGWRLPSRELIRMGGINSIIGNFSHLVSRMYQLSFRRWWIGCWPVYHLLDVILMMLLFSVVALRSTWSISWRCLRGCVSGDYAYTMASASSSMMGYHTWDIWLFQGVLACNRLRWTHCRRFLLHATCHGFKLFLAWRITTAGLSRTFTWLLNCWPFSRERINHRLGDESRSKRLLL